MLWFENVRDYMHLSPMELAFSVMMRSGRVTYEGVPGVVRTKEEHGETTLPGLRWHLPYPIETAEVVNTEAVKTVEVGYRGDVRSKRPQESLMLTDDENIVDLQFAVQYIVRDARDSATDFVRAAFRELLPADVEVNFSALVFHNLGPALGPVADRTPGR